MDAACIIGRQQGSACTFHEKDEHGPNNNTVWCQVMGARLPWIPYGLESMMSGRLVNSSPPPFEAKQTETQKLVETTDSNSEASERQMILVRCLHNIDRLLARSTSTRCEEESSGQGSACQF